ncbi:hypothetical protein [Geminocystis sp. NIES-3709]|uniref:hypothetical protein n=1 Tax=Geminocystis sp. NIES-3709 TaxID=1617448 RepID=UPI0005FC526B|nr:hypothetical protein [Geminocystis sp. NIES-3709]BAQ63901.1 hypothetical protein GM3709_666 [Geminocystis sp. NIES-3709]
MITKNKGNEKFFKFTEKTAKMLRTANLSKNARNLWDYLVTKNPFGDRDENLEYAEIQSIFKWAKHTYYRAKAELSSKGLIDFKNNQCQYRSTLKTKIAETVEAVTKTVKELQNLSLSDKNCKSQDSQPLSVNDSKLSQTIQTYSDLSDQSEELKDDRKIKERQSEIGKVKREEIQEDDGLINEGIEKEEPLTFDKRLENEEFIRYAQGKLPKARDIKRYLLTNDKTTGDKILERLWLEYQQWKTGKSNPNSTGNEYFDNLIEEYRKTKPWEEFNWETVNWEKLPCFNVWLEKAKICRDYTFTDDNSLGYTRNLRAVFYRWYEQFYSQKQESIPVNSQAMGLINTFKQIMGGVNYAY